MYGTTRVPLNRSVFPLLPLRLFTFIADVKVGRVRDNARNIQEHTQQMILCGEEDNPETHYGLPATYQF